MVPERRSCSSCTSVNNISVTGDADGHRTDFDNKMKQLYVVLKLDLDLE